jgi:hypothetical protein
MSRRFLRIGAIVVVFVLAAIGYVVFGSSTEINRSDMAKLVVHVSGVASLARNPYVSQPQSFGSVPSRTITAEAAKDPAQTGVYSIGWKNAASTGNADILLELLPTASTARRALLELESQYSAKKDYSAAGLKLVGPFTPPKVPHAFAREFTTASPQKGSPATTVFVVVFQVDRAAVSVLVEDVKTAGLEQGAARLAASEARLLRRVEPHFSMVASVHRPLTGLWFGLGALGVSVVIGSTPAATLELKRRRERRISRARRREQRHVTARGTKVLKRRAVPTWQTSRGTTARWYRRRARSRL